MAGVALDVQQLESLLRVQQVQVVQAVDCEALVGLLRQLLGAQQDTQDKLRQQQEELDALKAAQPQAGDGDETSKALDTLKDQLVALDQRLGVLEDAASQAPAPTATREPGANSDAAHGPPTAESGPNSSSNSSSGNTAMTSAPSAGGDSGLGQHESELEGLRQQQQQLAQQLADAAAAHKGLQQQVSALQDGKADRSDVREMLAEGLKGKADGSTVSQLKAQLGDKADRSELDALLNALSSSNSSMPEDPTASADTAADAGAGEGSSAPAASLAAAAAVPEAGDTGSNSSSKGFSQAGAADATARVDGSDGCSALVGGSRRGTRERDAAGSDLAQQLSKLQLQLAVLQDRVNKKADTQAVSDLTNSLETSKGQIADLSVAMQGLQQQLSAAQRGMDSLQDSLSSHAADPSLHSGGAHTQSPQAVAARRTDSGARRRLQDAFMPAQAPMVDPAAGGSSTEHAQQLAALTAKVAALEAALPDLQAACAEAVASSQQQQQRRRTSGEVPASSRLVQALAAQLSDLAGQVSRLSAQSTPVGAAADPASATLRMDSSSAAASADASLPAQDGISTSSDAAATAAAGATGPGLMTELVAELDGRLSELEAMLQELSDVKAGQAELQELRALLADTATQSDTEQLHRRLLSQQSQLDRLMHQISSLGGHVNTSSSSSSSGSNRPQSAVHRGSSSGSRQQHSSSAAHDVAPEFSLMGGAGLGGALGQQGSAGDEAVDLGITLGHGLDQQGVLQGLQEQLQAHQDSLEQLAEAVCLLATGQAAAVGGAGAGHGLLPGALQVDTGDSGGIDLAAGRLDAAGPVPETPSLNFTRSPAPQSAATATGTAAGASILGRPSTAAAPGAASAGFDAQPANSTGARGSAGNTGWWGSRGSRQPAAADAAHAVLPLAATVAAVGPGPQATRLKRLLQTGQVGRKMDWFDPTLLQKMAQRLAAVDAMLRSSAGMGSAGAGAGAGGDLDGKLLRRLAADVRQLKDRLAELAASGAGSPTGGLRALGQASDGDHSMLSGKPLGGYRCMACDRPLSALDSRPGPHLPTGQLPVSLVSGAEIAAGAAAALNKVPTAGAGSRRGTADPSVGPVATDTLAPGSSSSPDGRRVVGPQNWYTSVHGLPAEQLPKADVGPHLPPGGWRGTQALKEDGAAVGLLPALASRGGTAGGAAGGGTPRAATAGQGKAGADRGVSAAGGGR